MTPEEHNTLITQIEADLKELRRDNLTRGENLMLQEAIWTVTKRLIRDGDKHAC